MTGFSSSRFSVVAATNVSTYTRDSIQQCWQKKLSNTSILSAILSIYLSSSSFGDCLEKKRDKMEHQPFHSRSEHVQTVSLNLSSSYRAVYSVDK